MRAYFHIEREKSRELFKEVRNDNIDGSIHCYFHSQIELYFVDEGEIDTFVNHHRRVLKKDQMAVILSYDTHLFRSQGNSKSRILIIPPELSREFAAAIKNKQVKMPFIFDEAVVKRMKSFLDEIQKDNCNETLKKGYLYVILGIVLDNLFLENKETAVNTELSSKILFYLNQNFKNEISLETLSSALGYTKTYLSRYFKECFGVGINQYVNILRLRNALILMREGNTHTYSALESGFSSMRTFYRVFKEEFGETPKNYISSLEG